MSRSRSSGSGWTGHCELRQLRAVVVIAPQHVEASAPGDGEQPGVGPSGILLSASAPARPPRRPARGPRPRRSPGQLHQRRGQPARVFSDHAGQLGVDALAHTGLELDGADLDDRTARPGRHACSASSRSATSISAKPLTTSLPSTNGPSVITGSPRSRRTVVAVSAASACCAGDLVRVVGEPLVDPGVGPLPLGPVHRRQVACRTARSRRTSAHISQEHTPC